MRYCAQFVKGILTSAAAALIMVGAAGTAGAAEPEAAARETVQGAPLESEQDVSPAGRRGRIEFRRQNSERSTPDESTRTTLRLEIFLAGAVSRLRVDLPFPDEKTDFQGDPFQPRPGDLKLRAYFRPFQAGSMRLSSDIEVTFPTADPSSLGSGKYQLSAALHSVPASPFFVSGDHHVRYEWDLRQTVSVAGDADRKDINNTKPEFTLRDVIGGRHWLKLTLKPTIDWVEHGKTGGVLELEGGWSASRDWRFSIMGGGRLWGEGVSGIYRRRLELVAGYEF
jgi:hypothetical protein